MQGYYSTVQDVFGNAIPGGLPSGTTATVTVYVYGSTVLATLYSDPGGTTTISNPFQSGPNGLVNFFAANGAYTVSVTYNGVTQQRIIQLFDASVTPLSELIIAVNGLSDLMAIPSATFGAVRSAVTQYRSTQGDGGGGTWAWLSGNQSALVSSDPGYGIYAPPTSDLSGASGCWARQFSGRPFLPWWGAVPGSAIDTALANAVKPFTTGTIIDLGPTSMPYKLGINITIPAHIGLVGAGSGQGNAATIIQCTASGAGLSYADNLASYTGTQWGGFCIDGNNIATRPLVLGRVTQSTFTNVDVINAADADVVLNESQNNTFINCAWMTPANDCLVLDRGAGGNVFLRCEMRGPTSRNNLRFVQTMASPAVYSVPSQNRFFGCIFEGPAATNSAPQIYHGSGNQNEFYGCEVSNSLSTVDKTAIVMDLLGGVATSANLNWVGGVINGTLAHTTAVSLANGCSASFGGNVDITNVAAGFNLTTGATLNLQSFNFNNVTAMFSGSGAEDTIARIRLQTPQQITRQTISDSVFVGLVNGDAGSRWKLNALGAFYFGDGTDFTYDTIIERVANGLIQIIGTGASPVTTGNVQATANLNSTNFNSATDPINAVGKFAFKMCGDSTSGKPVFAAGSEATAVWIYADGTTAYTPT